MHIWRGESPIFLLFQGGEKCQKKVFKGGLSGWGRQDLPPLFPPILERIALPLSYFCSPPCWRKIMPTILVITTSSLSPAPYPPNQKKNCAQCTHLLLPRNGHWAIILSIMTKGTFYFEGGQQSIYRGRQAPPEKRGDSPPKEITRGVGSPPCPPLHA